jgi:isopentenyl-diphosphate delta-isomerase
MDTTVEEQVDIINSENEVVGTTGKSIVHRDGLLHRIVIGELVNAKGEFCFVRQASDRQDSGQFVSPIGGHVSAGEAVETALIRECQEEAGYTPKSFEFIGSTIYNREVIGRKENHLFLVYQIEAERDPLLNHESVEFRWFSINQIKQTLKSDAKLFGAAWHHLFKNLYPGIYKTT